MEGISASKYKGFRGYWTRRGYVKLNGSRRTRRSSRVELGSSPRRRFWRIRVKAKLRIPSPKKFLIWLRDAYVKMMLRLANSRMVSAGYGGGDFGIAAFGKRPLKEYDEKMIVEIYKSLVMAQGQLVPREAGKLSSAIICHR
ncbi:hypothetical protein PTKIN_Ptkin12aG0140800 [Pterospermum kingtungense]